MSELYFFNILPVEERIFSMECSCRFLTLNKSIELFVICRKQMNQRHHTFVRSQKPAMFVTTIRRVFASFSYYFDSFARTLHVADPKMAQSGLKHAVARQ